MGVFVKRKDGTWVWKATSPSDQDGGVITKAIGILRKLDGRERMPGDYKLNDDGEWEYVDDGITALAALPTKPEPTKYVAPSHSAYETWDYRTQPSYKKYIYLPYEGFDVKKWPRTYLTLLQLYHMPDWFKGHMSTTSYPEHVGGTHDGRETQIRLSP